MNDNQIEIDNMQETFDETYYLQKYVDVSTFEGTPIEHYMLHGKQEGRFPNRYCFDQANSSIKDKECIEIISKSEKFDSLWYKLKYLSENTTGMKPEEHYYYVGSKSGYSPSPTFDSVKYYIANPDVYLDGMNSLVHFEKFGKSEKRRSYAYDNYNDFNIERHAKFINSAQNDQLPLRYEQDFLHTTSGNKRVAIFAFYNEEYFIHDYVVYYLKELRKVADKIIFIADCYLPYTEIEKIKEAIDYCKCERHGEYDFGSYKRGYIYAMRSFIDDCSEELIFCNDSCYGPLFPFQQVFDAMNAKQCDYWGMTNNLQFGHHIQSYFLVLKKQIFNSVKFYTFLDTVKQQNSVQDVIIRYEIGLSKMLEDEGYTSASLVDCHVYKSKIKKNKNLLHYARFLIAKNNPLVKIKAMKFSQCNDDGILKTLHVINRINMELYYTILRHLQIPCTANKIMRQIRYSIILCVYNGIAHVSAAIYSALAQNYKRFEIIIVDDGSSDGTAEYIETEFSKFIESKKITIYKNTTNLGVSASRNIGVSFAKNNMICFLDADNTMAPDYLTVYTDNIVLNPGFVFYYAMIYMRYSNCKLGIPFDRKSLVIDNFIDNGTIVIEKNKFIAGGGFDEKMKRLVDYDFVLRYSKDSKPFFISRVVLDYNDSPDHSRITNIENFAINDRYLKNKNRHTTIVTTVILTYNHQSYIAQAIESALMQKGDFQHEILISDDGSSDETPKIVAEYARRYPMFIKNLSASKNVGISENYKRCFNAATGEFITMLEGDDYWVGEDKIQKQMTFLKTHNDCSMVFSRIKLMNVMNLTYRLLQRQDKLKEKIGISDFFSSTQPNLLVTFSTCMFRNEMVSNIPSYLYIFRITEFSLAMFMLNFGKIGFINAVDVMYRQHAGGAWTGSSVDEQMKSTFAAYKNCISACPPEYRKLVYTHIKSKNNLRKLFFSPNKIRHDYYAMLDKRYYTSELELWYYEMTEKSLNLDNPRTYNEKIQWLKLYDSTPLKTRLADKYLVREYVKEKIGEQYLIPLLGVWDSFDEIDFSKLPDQFVLKANHGCGWNIIVRNKAEFDVVDARNRFDQWMNTNFAFVAGFEMHYADIQPKIIAEEYIDNLGKDPHDYKVFLFNGVVRYIMFATFRAVATQMIFYDANWSEQEFVCTSPKYQEKIEKPKNLDELLAISKILGGCFCHARIDFYRLDDGNYKFGEITFTHQSGIGIWKPEEADLELGKLIDLSCCTRNNHWAIT